jgi:hypothetical protein
MNRPEILLHPNIPKPLHGLAPRVIKGQEWWDVVRQETYAKAGYCCEACGVPKQDAEYHRWLEAHELYEIDYKAGRMVFKELVALCHACHNYIHSGRMQILVDKGEMDEEKMEHILKRGDKILKDAKLKKPKPPTECASWADWVLIFEGEKYKGAFKSFKDWKNFYGRTKSD